MGADWLRSRWLWLLVAIATEVWLVFVFTKKVSGLPGVYVIALMIPVVAAAIVWILPRRKELLAYLIAILVPWGLIGTHVLDLRITLFDFMTVCIIALYLAEKLVTGDMRIRHRYLSRPMWFLLGAAVLSIAGADSKLASLHIIALMLQGCFLYLFIVRNIRSAKQIKRLILVFGLASVLPALVALYEFRTGVFISPTGAEAVPRMPLAAGMHVRPDGPFLNPNSMATYFVLALPILAVGFFVWRSRVVRLLNILAILCVALALVVSLSRTNWAAAAVSLLGMCLFALSFKYTRRIVFVTLIPFALTVALVVRAAPLSVIYRLGSLFMLRRDLAVQIRLELWHAARELFVSNPIIGIGIGNFPERYPPYVSAWVRDGFPNAHNAFLNTAAEMGVIGLLGLCWLLVVTVRAAVLNYRYAVDRNMKLLSLGLLGSWIAFWVGNFGDLVWVNPVHDPEVGILWVFLALTAIIDSAGKRGSLAAEAPA